MKKVALSAEKRSEAGTAYSKELRRNGKIPATMYGGEETESIIIDGPEFLRNFKTISENILIDLAIGKDDSKEVLIKDYQLDKVKGHLIHLDFYEIARGKKLHTKIPVHLTGTPVGVRISGGLLEHHLYELQIECLPKDMPEETVVDVSELDIGDAIHAGDLELPEGVVSLESPDSVIALVADKPTLEEEKEEEEEGELEGEDMELASEEEGESVEK